MVTFSKAQLSEAKTLLKEERVGAILFSEGTYQVEVITSKKPKTVLWPFLQLTDSGEIVDAFCTCDRAEKKGSCVHLALAYLKIMNEEPLHVRFRESLWNQIGQICADRHGYDPKALSVANGEYTASTPTGKLVFRLRPLNAKGELQLQTLIVNRPVETEETSLKFSNLPAEEIVLWKEGKPSKRLRYELSFWSDLAKWWMRLEEDETPYKITFSKEEPPEWITIAFPQVEIACALDHAHWPEVIPALATVHSPLPVHTFSMGKLERIEFSKETGSFLIDFGKEIEVAEPLPPEEQGTLLGTWIYFPDKGFYPQKLDPMLQKKRIAPKEVDRFFARHLKLIQKHLEGETIHPSAVPLRYHLFLDENHNLVVEGYLFEKGDLYQPGAHYFGQWVYLPQKGFYLLEEQGFTRPRMVIHKEELSDFIHRHRVFLQGFEGFQPHVSGVESHLGFLLDPQSELVFSTRLEFTEEQEHLIDLGDWIYAEGKGFYAKVTGRPGALIKTGTRVPSFEISSFIDLHKDELEAVPGFFADKCPLDKTGLSISFNDEGLIQVAPEFFFLPGIVPEHVKIFGDYTYIEGQGFASIPHVCRLPASYKETKVIDPAALSYFVSYELDLLYPHVLTIDPRLKKPEQMALRLEQLKRQPSAKTGQWVLQMNYETEIGTLSPHTLWEAIWEGKSYIFSDAGLLFLRDKRFDWLRQKTKKQWLQHGKSLRLNTLDFLRLSALEGIEEPLGNTRSEKSTRVLLRQFLELKAPTEMDTTGLKSDLRPYQRAGANWLWFLHSYGLSGLLCDEMGLGKTHQAMALMAGIRNSDLTRRPKFLVVCPTSVIYHWEKLIDQFLPQFRALIFHGVGRDLSRFTDEPYDVLVTSYGIVRTENEELRKLHFDVAVYDELQVAKNEKSLTHRALRNIPATMRVGLSGTPIENRLLELKALFDLVVPGYLPTLSVFREMFMNPIEKYEDEQKRRLLSRLIRPFLLRRKKSQVLTELPEKIEEYALCELSQEQKQLYREVIRRETQPLMNQLQDETKSVPVVHVFSMLSKLKQICNHPCLITKDYASYKHHESGKWDLFLELLEEVRDSGQKLVVFSQFLGMLDIMGMHLTEHKIGFAEIRGATKDRKEQVEKFSKDPHCEVFLGSLQAAGVGIDLIAASVVIHYDRWWNPAKEAQATDRVHRIGQKRGVQVFKLVTKKTVEEHIDRLIEKKKQLARGIIGFDEQDQIKGLERTELIHLLQLLEKDSS